MECLQIKRILCQGLTSVGNSALKIAVISDIHGNADALGWVLNKVQELSVGKTVFLGDLLTYGCQPREVLKLLTAYQKENVSVFLKGNHDQFYFDLASEKASLSYAVPEFVLESIYWTYDHLGGQKLETMFDWQESFSVDTLYFAHANPFLYGDWRYIESPEISIQASDILKEKGFGVGIFGHSHRQSGIQISSNSVCSSIENNRLLLGGDASFILNPGAIGQPRGTGLSFMVLTLSNVELEVDIYPVKVNLKNSIALVEQSSMSLLTKERLISYLGEGS